MTDPGLEGLLRVGSLAPLFVVAGVKVHLLAKELLRHRKDGKTEYWTYYPLDTYADSTYRPEGVPVLRRFRRWVGIQCAGLLMIMFGMIVWHLIDPLPVGAWP